MPPARPLWAARALSLVVILVAVASPPGVAPARAGGIARVGSDVAATYDVRMTLRYHAASMTVDARMRVTNTSDQPVNLLELNTVAGVLGRMRIDALRVDGRDVQPRLQDQTLTVTLGRDLATGESADVQVFFHAWFKHGVAGPDFLFARTNGVIQAYRWLPWISTSRPLDTPNFGFTFRTPVSPRVKVVIRTDRPLAIATGGRRVAVSEDGLTQTFVAEDVRDFVIAASPTYRITSGTGGDTRIQVFHRAGGPARALLAAASASLERLEGLLGDYPYPNLRVAQVPSGFGTAAPGLIWIPEEYPVRGFAYLVRHEVAHQWFYALVGNDLAFEPFAHEATSEFVTRHTLGLQRPSRCARGRLDLSVYQYTSACFYETVYVQGSLFLADLRRRMGDRRFWRGLRDYVDDNRFGIGGTPELLEALDDATPLDLAPVFEPRFPKYV